jgi:hypothetical protein
MTPSANTADPQNTLHFGGKKFAKARPWWVSRKALKPPSWGVILAALDWLPWSYFEAQVSFHEVSK